MASTRYRLLLAPALALALVLALPVSARAENPALIQCSPDHVDLRAPSSGPASGAGGQARFHVELAQTPAERAQGLMNRPSLARGAGMLFLYDHAAILSFWMRNTLIPLDIIFLDPRGVVVSIQENAQPLDETPLPSLAPAQMVLEINGGLARRLGIGLGSELRHPAIDPGLAAWPC